MPIHLPPFRIEAVFTALAETIDWGLAAYHIPDHWKATRGQGVKVAVLDTGINQTHPDLATAIEQARDFTGSPFGAADRNGHGTHTSGTIAARQNNLGVIGVAPNCRLLVGKVLGDDGSGSSATVAAGIDWACQAGADIISMSLGSPQPDDALLAAIQRAAAQGKFVIAAAGNEGGDDSVNYPARWPQTIAVAAVDHNGQLADFSSRGPEVCVAAPGEDVLSTWLGGGYAKLSGTSMAAPFVAGVTALLVALHRQGGAAQTPLATIDDLRDHLARTATDAGPAGKDPGYGWGLINPDSLLDEPPASTTPTNPVAPTTPPPGAPNTPGTPSIPGGPTAPTTPPASEKSFVLGGISINGTAGVLVFQPQ
ncbi:MAG TPA: S8 family peptidase [Pirellulales bacterium]|jgi:subtilisin family serine protease